MSESYTIRDLDALHVSVPDDEDDYGSMTLNIGYEDEDGFGTVAVAVGIHHDSAAELADFIDRHGDDDG